jgi:hypothetical protein
VNVPERSGLSPPDTAKGKLQTRRGFDFLSASYFVTLMGR